MDTDNQDALGRPQAALPWWTGLLLLLGTAVQHLAWQFDLEWLRRPLPVFPAIFGNQAIGKALGLLIGLITIGFLLEYALRNPVSTFDKWFFPELLYKAGGSFPGRPALQTCVTFFLLAFATLVFDRKDKRRIEAFQIVVTLAMFLPLMAIHGSLLSATAFQSLGRKPTTEMAIPTLILFCVSGAAFFSL